MSSTREATSRRPSDPAAYEGETWVPLTEKAQEVKCHVSRLHRARTIGTAIRSGESGEQPRVHLGGFKILGRWYTTREEWARYLRALNGVDQPAPGPSAGARTPSQRRAAVERANKVAEALGA